MAKFVTNLLGRRCCLRPEVSRAAEKWEDHPQRELASGGGEIVAVTYDEGQTFFTVLAPTGKLVLAMSDDIRVNRVKT